MAAITAGHKGSYVDALDTGSMKGATLGVVRNVFGDSSNPEAAAVNRVVEKTLATIKSAGAKLVDIEIRM